MTHSSATDLQYPSILCPLPRRTHSHPYHHHHHHHHHHHPSFNYHRSHSTYYNHNHHHQPPKSPASHLLHHYHQQQQQHPKPLLPTHPLTPTTLILNPSATASPIKFNSDDEALSEFLSLFSPSSPRSPIPIIINNSHSIPDCHPTIHPIEPSDHHPTPSSPTLIGGSDAHPIPIPPAEPSESVDQTRLDDDRLQIDSNGHPQSHPILLPKHLSSIVSSPISRCHNPLPRHAELDRLACRLSKPFESLQLVDGLDHHASADLAKVESDPIDQLVTDTNDSDNDQQEVMGREDSTDHLAQLLPALNLNPANEASSALPRSPCADLEHQESDHQ